MPVEAKGWFAFLKRDNLVGLVDAVLFAEVAIGSATGTMRRRSVIYETPLVLLEATN